MKPIGRCLKILWQARPSAYMARAEHKPPSVLIGRLGEPARSLRRIARQSRAGQVKLAEEILGLPVAKIRCLTAHHAAVLRSGSGPERKRCTSASHALRYRAWPHDAARSPRLKHSARPRRRVGRASQMKHRRGWPPFAASSRSAAARAHPAVCRRTGATSPDTAAPWSYRLRAGLYPLQRPLVLTTSP